MTKGFTIDFYEQFEEINKEYENILNLEKEENKNILNLEKEENKNILNLEKEENKNINSSFYKDKSEKLYRRLIKYKENYLYFIKDFNVPFDNNSSEQDLRIFKIKTKVSGRFRSMNSSNSYVDALSIIKTSIKRGIKPFV